MTHDPVELVAHAFYAAECSGAWSDQPNAVKERFRTLARSAIATLGLQMTEIRSTAMVPFVLQPKHKDRSGGRLL